MSAPPAPTWRFLVARTVRQLGGDLVYGFNFSVKVLDTRMGVRTANFRRIETMEKFRGRPAFSLVITQNRTVDILCPRPEAEWHLGLRYLVDLLRPPSLAMPRSSSDELVIMARRYFQESCNMNMGFCTSLKAPVKGPHKSVNLMAVREVRLLIQAQAGAANAPSASKAEVVRAVPREREGLIQILNGVMLVGVLQVEQLGTRSFEMQDVTFLPVTHINTDFSLEGCASDSGFVHVALAFSIRITGSGSVTLVLLVGRRRMMDVSTQNGAEELQQAYPVCFLDPEAPSFERQGNSIDEVRAHRHHHHAAYGQRS
jgi:hypothetical protein